MTSLARDILDRLRSILPGPATLHEPVFAGNEWFYLKECLDTGWVSSAGKFVDRFEGCLAEYTGAAHAVACVNGTSALHICLKLAGVMPGDEVLIPSLSFVATANAVAYCGATPHFTDSSETTLGLDPYKLASHLGDITRFENGACVNKLTGARLAAVVPMHAFGHPVDMDPLLKVSERFRVPIIEDAAESLGSYYKGRHTGVFGRISALSFNGNKIMTTGGGGAIITNDADLAKRAKHLTTTAKLPHAWDFFHDETGYNYRLPNINAALGCAQLERLPGFLAKKRALAGKYREAFAGLNGVRFFSEPEFACSNYWLNTLILDHDARDCRKDILKLTNENGLMTRPAWTPLHGLPMYRDCPRTDMRVTEDLAERIINIPSSAFLA